MADSEPDANALIDLRCSACGNNFAVTIRRYDSDDSINCPKCGFEYDEDQEEVIFAVLVITCSGDDCASGDVVLPYKYGRQITPGQRWTPPDINQWDLPSDEWRVTLGCLSCGLVATYPASDIRIDGRLGVVGWERLLGSDLHSVEFPCGDAHCKSRTKIYVDTQGGSEADLRAKLRGAHFRDWKMPCGHYMKPVPEKWYLILRVDHLW